MKYFKFIFEMDMVLLIVGCVYLIGIIKYDWVIEDEASACDSCLICNHYKYNHSNITRNGGKFVHICLYEAPSIIDITSELNKHNTIYGVSTSILNTSCQFFSRRSIG